MKNRFYYYDDHGHTVFLNDFQADQIYRQLDRIYVAQDLHQAIKEEFADNPYVNQMTLEDLLKYVKATKSLFFVYSDNTAMAAACRDIISDVIIPDQMKQKGGKTNETR